MSRRCSATLLQSARTAFASRPRTSFPTKRSRDGLCDAADRGVQVQILLPGPHADKRFVQLAGEANYPELLEHGVELWNFQPSMMHAKVMTVDGVVANIGSANLNSRSTACDEEINVVALDPDLVQVLDDQFDEDLERSVRIEEVALGAPVAARSAWAKRLVSTDPPLVLIRSTARRYCCSA